ncbi:MAG: phosphatidylserine decarboxylase [Dorea sp.]|nr:phosphatidylserine decarboxylase [Dorea sp.]
MHITADRQGRMWKENDAQDRLLEWMYTHKFGRLLLKILVNPHISEIGGKFLESGISRIMIRPFIKRHSIEMDLYEDEHYRSYNDFFKRRLKAGARIIEREPEIFISPCDSRLSVFRIDEEESFSVKHADYTLRSLLRDRKLASRYEGGYIWIFRLCVEDYHRYVYVDSGRESKRRRIPGVYHTVNPAAGDRIPIYKENTREYSVVKTKHFGEVIQMEVGALLVGKIENRKWQKTVVRGQEKGNFAFGGSTVILITRRGRVRPDKDIMENSKKGIETQVKMGEKIGLQFVAQANCP